MAIRSDNPHLEAALETRQERRTWRRYLALECDWLRAFRLYPGRGATLMNLSRGGALVEARERFSPGCWLQMKIATESELLWGRAQVIRCEVAQLSAHHGATYRTALGFDRVLTLSPLVQGREYPVPSAPAAPISPAGSDYPESA